MKDVVISILATTIVVFLFAGGKAVNMTKTSTVQDCKDTGFSRQGDVVIKCQVLDKGSQSR